ncbi:MAG TPA: PilZ domain-containing protein [Planctomycetota bacterium]
MSQPTTPPIVEQRQDPRQELQEFVTIEFEAGALVGSGQNISAQGVFFTTTDSLPVTVRISGKSEVVRAELVRYETLGDGQVGIAVRFLRPNPTLTV